MRITLLALAAFVLMMPMLSDIWATMPMAVELTLQVSSPSQRCAISSQCFSSELLNFLLQQLFNCDNSSDNFHQVLELGRLRDAAIVSDEAVAGGDTATADEGGSAEAVAAAGGSAAGET